MRGTRGMRSEARRLTLRPVTMKVRQEVHGLKRPALVLGGAAAVAGGALRAAASFAPVLIHSDTGRECLYIAVDVCLTIGLVAFYRRHA